MSSVILPSVCLRNWIIDVICARELCKLCRCFSTGADNIQLAAVDVPLGVVKRRGGCLFFIIIICLLSCIQMKPSRHCSRKSIFLLHCDPSAHQCLTAFFRQCVDCFYAPPSWTVHSYFFRCPSTFFFFIPRICVSSFLVCSTLEDFFSGCRSFRTSLVGVAVVELDLCVVFGR